MAPPSVEVTPHLVAGPTLTLDHSGQSACETLHSQRGKGLHFFPMVVVQFSVNCFILLRCVFHFSSLELA